MAKRPSAGDLYYSVVLEKRAEQQDEYGNTVGDWAEQFTARASFTHLHGSEGVMAARLDGKHVQVVRLRASQASRAVTTDWRVRDRRTGQIFNIRDVTHETDRQWVTLLCETGVAT